MGLQQFRRRGSHESLAVDHQFDPIVIEASCDIVVEQLVSAMLIALRIPVVTHLMSKASRPNRAISRMVPEKWPDLCCLGPLGRLDFWRSPYVAITNRYSSGVQQLLNIRTSTYIYVSVHVTRCAIFFATHQ